MFFAADVVNMSSKGQVTDGEWIADWVHDGGKTPIYVKFFFAWLHYRGEQSIAINHLPDL